METLFEISSTQYDENKIHIIKALSHLQTQCGLSDTYKLGDPVSRFGWTFVPLWLKPSLIIKIQEKFSDMIQKAKGRKNDEKLTNFMMDFFESRGCKIRLKLVKSD
jgi:hypothetical protein